MSHDSLLALRRLITDHRPTRARDGFPAHVRSAVATGVRPLRVAGWTIAALSRELGVASCTVKEWLEAPTEPTFRPVTVVERPPVMAASADVVVPRRPLILVTPGGFRVEGLDLDGVAALLLRLS